MTRPVKIFYQDIGAILMVIFGIAEGGRLLQVQNTLTNAAREGVRIGIAPFAGSNTLPTSEIIPVVKKFLDSAGIPSSQATIDLTSPDPAFTAVTITYSYKPLTGLFPFLQINLVGRSTMKNETSW